LDLRRCGPDGRPGAGAGGRPGRRARRTDRGRDDHDRAGAVLMPAQQNVGVLLALRGTAEEELVRTIAIEPGLRVVRRCADVAELTAAAVAGLGSVAVLDADLGVDRTLLDRLRAHGVRTIVSC